MLVTYSGPNSIRALLLPEGQMNITPKLATLMLPVPLMACGTGADATTAARTTDGATTGGETRTSADTTDGETTGASCTDGPTWTTVRRSGT